MTTYTYSVRDGDEVIHLSHGHSPQDITALKAGVQSILDINGSELVKFPSVRISIGTTIIEFIREQKQEPEIPKSSTVPTIRVLPLDLSPTSGGSNE